MKVYHEISGIGLIAFLNRTEGEGNKYRLVAEMDHIFGMTVTEALAYAFEKTNTINRPWWENPQIKKGAKNCRSTSCGDIIEYDGSYYLVAAVGFKMVQKPEIVD